MDQQGIIENLKIELRRGTQTMQILILLKEAQYGYSLLQALEEKAINIEAGTLYPLLRRLETQGLLTSSWDTTEARPRKYYKLSNLGLKVLEELIEIWKETQLQMALLLKEVYHG